MKAALTNADGRGAYRGGRRSLRGRRQVSLPTAMWSAASKPEVVPYARHEDQDQQRLRRMRRLCQRQLQRHDQKTEGRYETNPACATEGALRAGCHKGHRPASAYCGGCHNFEYKVP